MQPSSLNQGGSNPISFPYPETALVVKSDHRMLHLIAPGKVKAKYGFEPGTILYRNANETVPGVVLNKKEKYRVIGINTEGELLLQKVNRTVRQLCVDNSEQLKNLGFNWQEKSSKESAINDEFTSKKRKRMSVDAGSQVLKRMKTMFESQDSCDVIFQCEGEKIGGHSFILQASSPYFSNLLRGNFRESLDKEKTISIENCTAEDFKRVLNFLYTGAIDLNMENVLLIAALANRFLIEDLKNASQTYLSENLKPNHALVYFQQIVGFDCFLLPLIREYILEHAKEIAKEDLGSLLTLSKQTWLDLIQAPKNQHHCHEMLPIWFLNPSEIQEKIEFVVNDVFPHFPPTPPILMNYLTNLNMSLVQSQLDDMCASMSSNHWMKLMCAGVLYQRNEFDAAKKKIDEILAKDPQHVSLLLLCADILGRLNQLDSARPIYEEVLEKDPHNVVALCSYGEALRIKDPFEAMEKLSKALKIDPHHIDALCLHGYAALQTNHRKLAETLFQKALDQDSNNLSAQSGYAEVLRLQGNTVRAKKEFEQILAKESKNVFALSNYAKLLASNGNPDMQNLAREKVQEALHQDPQDMFALSAYTVVSLRCDKDFSLAEQTYHRVRSLVEEGNVFIKSDYDQALLAVLLE